MIMVQINSIHVSPPLLNSSCAWSSDLAQLKALYDSPYTGAITTRTATLSGYMENHTHTVRLLADRFSCTYTNLVCFYRNLHLFSQLLRLLPSPLSSIPRLDRRNLGYRNQV
jgi:hypothetical protein